MNEGPLYPVDLELLLLLLINILHLAMSLLNEYKILFKINYLTS